MKATKVNPLLTVKDIKASVHFYEEILGFKKNIVIDEKGKLRYVDFTIGTSALMLVPEDSRAYDVQQDYKTNLKGIGLELYVDIETRQELEKLFKELKKKKVSFLKDLHETSWETFQFHITDPDGYVMIFSAPKGT